MNAYATITIETKGKVRFTEVVHLQSLSWFLSCLAIDVKVVSILIEAPQEIVDGDEDLPF